MMPQKFLTVDVAASDQNLVTLANLKADLGITSTTDDAYLTRQIAAVSQGIAKYCSRVFKQETVTETFHVSESHMILVLSRYPVSDIASVTIDGVAAAETEYQAAEPSGFLYRKDTDGRLIAWEPGIVVVSYDGGYETVPTDLEQSCVSIIKSNKSARTRDPSLRGVKVPEIAEFTYWVPGSDEPQFPPGVSSILDLYKRVTP